MNAFLELLLSTLRVATPLLFAAQAGLLVERSGVIHIALEGCLLVGAFSAAVASHYFHSPWIAAGVAMIVTALFSLIYGFFAILLRADQIVSATAMNFLAFGLVPLFCKMFFDVTGSTPQLELADRFSVQPFYVAFVTVIIVYGLLKYTRFGLQLTAAGEKPEALATAGINVGWVRMKAMFLSGLIVGFGGATLSLFLSSSFSKGMTAGRGFMALAALIFGKWKPIPTLFACLFFGLTEALQIRIEGTQLSQILPLQLIQVLPYFVTIVILSGFIGKSRAPTAIGRPLFLFLVFVLGSGCNFVEVTQTQKSFEVKTFEKKKTNSQNLK